MAINWQPMSKMTERLRDGRWLLFYRGKHCSYEWAFELAKWGALTYPDEVRGLRGATWITDECYVKFYDADFTHFAELNLPEN